jgi:hypothetical protein
MPEATFPFVVYPSSQSLPFLSLARLISNDVWVADNIPITIWPSPGGVTEVGASYDHQGESPLDSAGLYRFPNVRVFVDDARYTVVDIEENRFLPHVALRLREMRPMI